MPGVVKVKVFAVLLCADGERHLVLRGSDPSKTPQHFHRLLGGHLEFGETLAAGIVREIAEELDVTLVDPRPLGWVENIFVYDGSPGHEIVLVYAATLGEDVVPPEGAWRQDNGDPMWVEWRAVEGGEDDVPLYPDGVQALVEQARAERAH